MRTYEGRVHQETCGGFAAVDALVALIILSSTLVLALSDLQTSAKLSGTAQQTSEAIALGRGLLMGNQGAGGGYSAGLAWTLETRPLQSGRDDATQICVRDVVIRSRRDGRIYRFADASACG